MDEKNEKSDSEEDSGSAKTVDMTGDHAHIEEGADAASSSLRRGNINFDILKPQGIVRIKKGRGTGGTGDGEGSKSGEAARTSETGDAKALRSSSIGSQSGVGYHVASKRGQFDRGRRPNPIGAARVLLWASSFVISQAALLFVLVNGKSLLWITALPFLTATALWSFLMLVLFYFRPR